MGSYSSFKVSTVHDAGEAGSENDVWCVLTYLDFITCFEIKHMPHDICIMYDICTAKKE